MMDPRDPQQPPLFLDSLGRRQQPRWLGWPLNFSNGTWCTVIINRKPVLDSDR
jgi:hypothetical protein